MYGHSGGVAPLFLSLAFVAMTGSAWAQGNEVLRHGSGDPTLGKQISEAELCQECHGADGRGTTAATPRLAGQFAAYLIKQVRDFRSGARKHSAMSVIAPNIADEDLVDIAAYFARQEAPPGPHASAESGLLPAASPAVARALFEQGDAARGIPACAACHGPDARGAVAGNVISPALRGQQLAYLRGQMASWKLGERRNDATGQMNALAAKLSAEEIEALAEYLSRL
ncbi:putative cytochrome c4 [Azoarcus olearius]|uniref:c-type cytochrome n=1 Tax=Azoarcus sp. (strain BH72) TaxID=418699 RepID=UPI0008062D50|nr:c-type cytochrome [Azoarcus olearius]ANQ85502.1 putative cytochrome c4 [Azoarcus olearius]